MFPKKICILRILRKHSEILILWPNGNIKKYYYSKSIFLLDKVKHKNVWYHKQHTKLLWQALNALKLALHHEYYVCFQSKHASFLWHRLNIECVAFTTVFRLVWQMLCYYVCEKWSNDCGSDNLSNNGEESYKQPYIQQHSACRQVHFQHLKSRWMVSGSRR